MFICKISFQCLFFFLIFFHLQAEESGVDEGSSSDKASGGGGAEGVAGPWQPVGGHGPSPPHGVGMHHFPPHATPPFLPVSNPKCTIFAFFTYN